MTFIRWKLYRALCHVGWWICPQPHKGYLQKGVGSWEDVKRRAEEAKP